MFPFRKKKRTKEPEKAPRWFMWLMGVFVVYALATNIFTDNVSNVRREMEEKEIVRTGDDLYFNYAAVRSADKSGRRPLFMRDIEQGQGKKADCWYHVDIRHKLYREDGERLIGNEQQGEPLQFHIGRREVPLALERVVLGMQKGGTRAVTAAPSQLFADHRFAQEDMTSTSYGAYVVALESLNPPANLPLSDLGLRLYDDVEGKGALAQCTDRVRVKLRLWDVHENPLWPDDTKNAIFVHLGEGLAPYAIERGLLGMRVGGKRTLIVPAGYMKPIFASTETLAGQPSSEEATPAADTQDTVAPNADAKGKADILEADTPKSAEAERSGTEKVLDKLAGIHEEDFPWQELPALPNEPVILELELLPLELPRPEQPL
jgi:FKBP-type peptidyl-prolyl cis-trans isomerase 2